MKITTESGSVYFIDAHGHCHTNPLKGQPKSYPTWFAFNYSDMEPYWTVADLVDKVERLPAKEGRRLYVEDDDAWRVSTPIATIELP